MESLTSSLAHQVPMDPSTAAAPVNRLPNELVYAFLVKLEMPELIRLRLVSPRWKAVIESIGQTKKSLIVSFGCNFRFETIFSEITRRFFFNEIELKRDFVFIKLKLKRKSYYQEDSFGSLLALFPSVEQLVILSQLLNEIMSVLMLWPVPQITTLSLSVISPIKSLTAQHVAHFDNWINSMASLKRLDLRGGFESHLRAISPNIYANLEHFSHHTFGEFNELVAKQVLGNLGPNCTRLSLTSSGLEPTNVLDWLNADLIGRLTHLAVPFSPDFEWELEEACDKFTSLQTLYIRMQWFDSIELTPRLFNVLSRLKLSGLYGGRFD